MVKPLLLLLLVTLKAQALPSDLTCQTPVSLSQKDVAELILKQGRRTQEINLQYQQLRLAVAQARANYQWDFTATSGYLFDKSVGLQTSQFTKRENLTSTATLSKSFLTGTTVGVEYQRTSFKGDVSASAVGPASSVATEDYLGLNLAQNLWNNFFGIADRGLVDSAELSYKSSALLRTNELEEAVLDAIRAFWAAYVSEQNFKDAMDSRDRSKKLMEAVRRKSGFGYANPGELAQAQADYEVRVQAVRTNSMTYLQNLDVLNTLLSFPTSCEVKFAVSEVIPPVPQLPEKSITDLRVIRSGKLKVQAAERASTAAESRDAPFLNLEGKIYSYGLEEDGNGAYSDMISGGHPQYYVGLKFQYLFGEDLTSENRVNKRYAKELEMVRLSRLTQESVDQQAQAQRKVQTAYAAVLSMAEQKKFREKAMQELGRSFNQGRTDISVYIEAMNKFSEVEIQYSQAIGSYQTALNEWAAIRDELIPDAQED